MNKSCRRALPLDSSKNTSHINRWATLIQKGMTIMGGRYHNRVTIFKKYRMCIYFSVLFGIVIKRFTGKIEIHCENGTSIPFALFARLLWQTVYVFLSTAQPQQLKTAFKRRGLLRCHVTLEGLYSSVWV